MLEDSQVRGCTDYEPQRPTPIEGLGRTGVWCVGPRVLKPGGRILFTDPIVITGPLTNEEIVIRSSIGFFLFVLPMSDDRLLQELSLKIEVKENVTENMAKTARRWHAARGKREVDLRHVEGDETFEGQQRFFEVAARIATERRLSRIVYVAAKMTCP